jgi:flavodoxin
LNKLINKEAQMDNLILCSKETGNTRRICDAIAGLAGWESRKISGNDVFDLSGYNTVIIGTGVYGGLPHKNITAFIRKQEKSQVPREVHVLITWLGRGKSDRSAFRHIQKECLLKGIAVSPDYAKFLGHSFGVLHVGHPDEQEISKAKAWAQSLCD